MQPVRIVCFRTYNHCSHDQHHQKLHILIPPLLVIEQDTLLKIVLILIASQVIVIQETPSYIRRGSHLPRSAVPAIPPAQRYFLSSFVCNDSLQCPFYCSYISFLSWSGRDRMRIHSRCLISECMNPCVYWFLTSGFSLYVMNNRCPIEWIAAIYIAICACTD